MPKIKNWSHEETDRELDLWLHDTKPASVRVIDVTPLNVWEGKNHTADRYHVVVNRSGDSNKTVAKEDTKREAKKAAVDWMRNHPDV